MALFNQARGSVVAEGFCTLVHDLRGEERPRRSFVLLVSNVAVTEDCTKEQKCRLSSF